MFRDFGSGGETHHRNKRGDKGQINTWTLDPSSGKLKEIESAPVGLAVTPDSSSDLYDRNGLNDMADIPILQQGMQQLGDFRTMFVSLVHCANTLLFMLL